MADNDFHKRYKYAFLKKKRTIKEKGKCSKCGKWTCICQINLSKWVDNSLLNKEDNYKIW